MLNRLILVGSNTVHTYRFLKMISSLFREIYLITNEYPKSIFRNELPKNLKKIFVLNFSLKKFTFIKTAKKIEKIINLLSPDILHIHQANTMAFTTLLGIKNAKFKKVLTTWGSDILILPNNFILKKLVKFCLQNVDVVTSDSFYMTYKIKKMLPNANVVTVTLGIDDIFLNAKVSIDEKENIIFSNRMHKEIYNIDKLIVNFKRFIDLGHKDWYLIIAGEGPITKKLKNLAVELGLNQNVEFVGFLNKQELVKFYKKAKIFVSVPSSDATSVSLLEAMAMGCIPVVSNLPANLEWVIDGITGIIVDDLNSLDRYLLRAKELSNEKHKKAFLINRAIVKQNCSSKEVISRFRRIYEF